MLQNPQVKFQRQISKAYLFPKYPGKFFVQTQKLKQYKSNHYLSSPKPILYHNFSKEDYKEMKVQAQYMQKIQQLKKKLQRQIGRYNKHKNKNDNITKSLKLDIEERNSSIKYKDIKIGDYSNDQSNTQRKLQKLSQIRQVILKKYPFRIPMKNNLQTKRKAITQHEPEQLSYRKDDLKQFLTNRSTKSINCKQSNHLPLIPQRSNNTQIKHSFSISSSIRYSLPSRIFKNKSRKKIKIQFDQYKCDEVKNYLNQLERDQHQIKNNKTTPIYDEQKVRALGKGMKDHKGKKNRKNKDFRETFLKGWDYSYQKETDNINNSQLMI